MVKPFCIVAKPPIGFAAIINAESVPIMKSRYFSV